MKHLTDTVLMIRPTNFGYNDEAAESNSFQNKPEIDSSEVQTNALKEFDAFKAKLEALHVNVIDFADTNTDTPDSIFPNNWFSTHQSNELILYPMAVANRRAERRDDIIADLVRRNNYKLVDFSDEEANGRFLEGTGSLIFDHEHKTVYAAISPRTSPELVEKIANELNYKAITFEALGMDGELIYHTNVMLCIGDDYAIIGADTIIQQDRERVLRSLRESGKELITFSNDQIYNSFAGNMLQIKNTNNESILVMSQKAFNSLNDDQRRKLEKLNDFILPASIPTIESVGGGSVRCMLAEIFHS